MLMPKTWQRLDRALVPHLSMMGAMLLYTLVLSLWPQAVTGAGYQCALHALFGIRCPFCGMTRDFAAILHGREPRLNPCSWLAALVVYVVYPVAVLVAWRRRRLNWFYGTPLRYGVWSALVIMTAVNNLR